MKTIAIIFICMQSFLWAFDASIPVLTLSDYFDQDKKQQFLETLDYAISEVGFFALQDAGVDVEILDRAYKATKDFFALDLETKMQLLSLNGQRGYIPGESAKEENRVDYKEFYHVGRDLEDKEGLQLQSSQNVWPEGGAEFQESLTELFEHLDICKDVIGLALAEVLGKEKDFINNMTKEGRVLLRAIHYPKNPPKEAIWAGAHTDINFFTILPRATAKGLQVQNKKGEWIDVIVPDGAFVINCGDMLENLTNGYCRSSYHRVVDQGRQEERYSMVFFVHPKGEDRLDPLPEYIAKAGNERRYANVSASELLSERLIDLGLATKELMEYFVQSGAIERLKEVGRFSSKARQALLDAGFAVD